MPHVEFDPTPSFDMVLSLFSVQAEALVNLTNIEG